MQLLDAAKKGDAKLVCVLFRCCFLLASPRVCVCTGCLQHSRTAQKPPFQVVELLKKGAEVGFQEEEEGKSALMLAAEQGHADTVEALLERGAPWNALDRKGQCAGQYAFGNEHHQVANRIRKIAFLFCAKTFGSIFFFLLAH